MLRIPADLLKVLARQLVIGINLQGALKMNLCFREIAGFGQRAAQIRLCIGVVRTQADGCAIMFNRLNEFVLRSKSICQIVVRVEIVWLRLECRGKVRNGLAESAHG